MPLGALAAGFGLALAALPAQAQQGAAPPAAAASASEATLPVIRVKASAESQGKESYQSTTTGIGKGNQALRDVPQSVTVVTERLLDDRNLDTLKDALHATAGITFLAAEGGEEDIRLRGFSLASTGDIFIDGLRDPAFYDRDTFNNDRIEVLRGSASMLFGRGSTGGVVNQVNKQPYLINGNEVSLTGGTGNYLRITTDLNQRMGEDAAIRVDGMVTRGNNGGLRIAKEGIAPAYRWGIGTADEFMASLYMLRNRNGINYGLPWLEQGLIPVATNAYYGAASDYNNGGATYATLSHIHRFQGGGELKTVFRQGDYERDQRASAIRFCRQTVNATTGAVTNPDCPTDFATLSNLSDATPLNRGTNNKVQNMQTRTLQSDYSGKFQAGGMKHALLTGADLAQEDFANYNMTLPAGVILNKNAPRTTIGSPNDGTSVDEALRLKNLGRTFEARALGVYVQDLVEVTPGWKVLAGLRWDQLEGRYWSAATTSNTGVVTPAVTRTRSDSLWSKRFGLLYQPTPLHSFHMSYGTSFNTSGDTYQYDNQTENTGPERSGNFELGAKIDSASGDFSMRMALFHATKYNERNRDPDSAATQNLLSGKRHSAGIELDLSGRITPAWEVFGSYAWTPIARIDVGAPGSTPGVGEGEGTRSSLTPRHSGSIWSTFQVTPQWRLGGGLNARSSQTPNRNPGFAAPRFVTADVMAEYQASEALSFKLNVSNLTDKLYADALYSGHYISGAPRNVQLTATVRF
jgi:catecholate siderophore receptor